MEPAVYDSKSLTYIIIYPKPFVKYLTTFIEKGIFGLSLHLKNGLRNYDAYKFRSGDIEGGRRLEGKTNVTLIAQGLRLPSPTNFLYFIIFIKKIISSFHTHLF